MIAITSYHEERYWIITRSATESWVCWACVCVSILTLCGPPLPFATLLLPFISISFEKWMLVNNKGIIILNKRCFLYEIKCAAYKSNLVGKKATQIVYSN